MLIEDRKFQGVVEHTFNSILRRSLVVHFKGRFFTKEYIVDQYGDAAKAAEHGVFERDPSLKDFLKDEATVGASLHFLSGWLHKRQSGLSTCRWAFRQATKPVPALLLP